MRCLPLLLLLAACGASVRPDPKPAASDPVADLILLAGRVHPMVADQPDGEAVAIGGGRILAVASRDGALRFRGAKTRIVRFEGAHVYPGLTDAHGHVADLGAAGVDLRGARTLAEVVERVAAKAAQEPPGTWVRGRGWDQTLWPDKAMPDHRELSARVPDHPVWLRRIDGHAALANAKAIALAKIDAATRDPDGGRILRLPDGQPSGVFVDRAMSLVPVPPTGIDPAVLEEELLKAQDACFRAGLTRVHDAGVSGQQRRMLRSLEAAGKWKLGIYGMLGAPSAVTALPEIDDPGPRARLRFRAVKIYADGALGSRGAALLADYADEPGNRGLFTTPAALLRQQIGWCRDRGYQPCIHAIGDAANKAVLDAYAEVLSKEDRQELRPRIEHAQVVAPADLDRFAALGVIASMQPTHLTSDDWAPDRLGSERLPGAYAFRTLLAKGVRVAFGSDFAVEHESPFGGIFAAVTTRPPDEPTAEPLRPDQQIDRRQALLLFTQGAAYAAFEEDVRGRLLPGFEADLTIVDRDLEQGPETSILGARVLAVVVGGELIESAAR